MPARLLLALVAGVVLSLGFEPVTQPWVMPFALAGLWVACHGRSVRGGVLAGLLFGGGFMYVHIFWMARSVGVDAWFALATVLMLFHGVAGGVAAHLTRYRWWPCAVPVLWVALEHVRGSWPFSGMPWGRLSFAVIDTPLAPALPYLGATLVSLVVALAGALLAWGWLRRDRVRQAGLALAALVAVMALPALFPWQPPQEGTVRAAVVQGNVPGPGDDILWDHRQVTRNHVDATIELARQVRDGTRPQPEFVLWPENSTAVDPFTDDSTREQITAAAEAIGVPVLVGGIVDAGPGEILNQGIVWDPVTGPGERYTKHHPVPFGEYLPFRSVLEGWNLGRLAPIHSDMLAGSRVEPLRIAGHLVADVICFDIAYDDVLYAQVARGGEVLTVQTSNTTFINTRQIDQQYAITRVRAVELGRSVLVASPNGISGVIGPDGASRAVAPKRTTTVLDAEVPLVSALTPAVRIGEWPARISALAVCGWVVVHLGFRVLSYRRGSRPTDRAVADHLPGPPAEKSEASHL